MRTIVFLLILANLLFFAWTRDYLGLSRDPDAYRAGEELRADQIRIVSNDEPPPETPRKEKAAKPVELPPAEVCVRLAEIPPGDADTAATLLAEKLPAYKVGKTETRAASSHWVYIPPLKSKREADIKVAELKKLGVKEFFLVQESGPNNLAISLGLFSTEDAAAAALEALREKGVRSARMVERPGKATAVEMEIRGPEAQGDEMRLLIGQALPKARLASCPARNGSQ